jgi:hypothetical protein
MINTDIIEMEYGYGSASLSGRQGRRRRARSKAMNTQNVSVIMVSRAWDRFGLPLFDVRTIKRETVRIIPGAAK